MATSLRDELASLKIDRSGTPARVCDEAPAARTRSPRGPGGFAILAWVLWLVPLGLLGAAGTYGYRQYDQIRARTEVTVGVVQTMTPGEAEKLLSAKGYLKSRYQAMIGAKVPGRVEHMYVEEGTRVKKGQVLAVLEHNDLSAQLASKQAQLRRTEAELEEARIDLKEKEREARRAARLAGQRSMSAEDAEKLHATRDMAAARAAALEAAVTLNAANVRESEATIRNMSLYAPFDGTVVEKQGEEGEVITPSALSTSAGRSAVVTMADLSRMDVETDIAENLMSRIALNQPAEISVSAVPSKHYRGRLRQVIPMGDRARGTVKVKVEVLDPDERLFPELVATVHFLPDRRLNNPDAGRSYLFVPKAALFRENGHDFVWVVDTRPQARKRAVEIAPTNDELARVESGLKAGDQVVLNPPKTLHDGEVVKLAE
jgi:RND family efflux transporter MFP subunit